MFVLFFRILAKGLKLFTAFFVNELLFFYSFFSRSSMFDFVCHMECEDTVLDQHGALQLFLLINSTLLIHKTS